MSCSTSLLSNYMILLLRNQQIESVLYTDSLKEAIDETSRLLSAANASCDPECHKDSDSCKAYVLTMPARFKAILPNGQQLIAERHSRPEDAPSEGFLAVSRISDDDPDETEDLAVFCAPENQNPSCKLALQLCTDPEHDAPTNEILFDI